MQEGHTQDRQPLSPTREAIERAFVRLVMKRRYETIRISDIIAEAHIGRATFYDHFHSKNDVLIAVMLPVLLALSTAASGKAARSYIKGVMSHVWEKRSTGRVILNSVAAPAIQRHLADMIRARLALREGFTSPHALRAIGIAAAQLAMLRSWLAGEASGKVDDITDLMMASFRLGQPER